MKSRFFLIFFAFVVALSIATTTAEKVPLQNAVILTLDRESAYYLFSLPKEYGRQSLFFGWTVQTDPSLEGELAVLQYSRDSVEWHNLVDTIVSSDGTVIQEQQIDSSWAINGRNYLRAVVGNYASNIVSLTVNVGIGYWVAGGVVAVFSTLVALWYVVNRKWIRKPDAMKRLQSRIYLLLHGKEMWLFLLAGLLIRVILAPFTEQRFDSYVSRLWPALILRYRLYPFEPAMPLGYPLILRYSFPPIWLFISSFSFMIWWAITGFTFPKSPTSLWKHGVDVGNVFESYRSFIPQALPMLDLFLKIPNILADIGIGYLLLNLARSEKQKKTVLFLWILNPFVIQVSTVWGVFDPISTFSTLCFIYFLKKRRFFVSAGFLFLGVGTKLYPVFFLIPVLIYLYEKEKLKVSLKYFSVAILTGMLIFGSFLVFPGGFDFLYRLFFFKASPDWYGKNLFGGLTWQLVLSLFQWSGNLPIFLIIFVPIYMWLNYSFWKAKKDFDSLVIHLASVLLLLYLSYTVVNPQYAFWVLPFLLFLHLQGKFSSKLYAIFSAVPLIYIYGYYNPLQFVTPVTIWQEWNYPPWSDMIRQIWPYIFGDVILNFLAMCLFPFIVLISLVSILQIQKYSLQKDLSHIDDNFSESSKENNVQEKSACVIVPTLNENENIEKLIVNIEKTRIVDHVIVVDDGSTDGTLYHVHKLMEKYDNITLIERGKKMGIGSAIREGLRKSMTLKPLPKFIITMDADLSHNPKDIPKLLEHSRKSKSDIVIGSRYVNGGLIVGWSWHRKLLSAMANALTGLLLGIPVTDCTSGFKCYRRRAIKTLLPSSNGKAYEFQVETLHIARRNGMTLTEIPIVFFERRHGRSKLGAKGVFRFFLFLIHNVATYRFRQKFEKMRTVC